GSTATKITSYATAGNYTVSLKVTDNNGQTSTISHQITVTTPPPPGLTASFTASPTTGVAGQSVTFDGSGSTDTTGPITRYKWDLDGSGAYATDTGSTSHETTTFAQAGTYNISLKVTDSTGATSTQTQSFTVDPAPSGQGYNATVMGTSGLQHLYRMNEAS